MKPMNPLFLTDFYKVHHHKMYPEGTTKIYSNFTPRNSRVPGINKVVVLGIQYLIKEYLIDQFNKYFFAMPKEQVLAEYKEFMDCTLGKDAVDIEHIGKLHDLQYLPLKIKALKEGTLCPIGVPVLTITNTVDHAYWLVNYVETLLSNILWKPMTAATIAFKYRTILNKWALKTTNSTDFVQWQGHNFSARGNDGVESGFFADLGHETSFTGTDTVWSIMAIKDYYNTDYRKELVGSSVPATEHSVMCMGSQEGEIETFQRLLDLYPNNILSVVSDTWNLWDVCTKYLPQLKEKIMKRNGKLVIRPDSGDPVDIICGVSKINEDYISTNDGLLYKSYRDGLNTKFYEKGYSIQEQKGVIELLWDTFGGTEIKGADGKMYKILDPHIGAIYGDSITTDRAEQICQRLADKGFASTNVVFGIGSYTYQYNTRDTFGFAMKATYGELSEQYESNASPTGFMTKVEPREIFKNPITDNGVKKSAKGLLMVERRGTGYYLHDQCTPEQEAMGSLRTIFKDSKLIEETDLTSIRERVAMFLQAETNVAV